MAQNAGHFIVCCRCRKVVRVYAHNAKYCSGACRQADYRGRKTNYGTTVRRNRVNVQGGGEGVQLQLEVVP